MKTLFIVCILLTGFIASGQEDNGKNQKKDGEVKIQTSAQCGMCKERIEKNLSFERGVKSVDLDLETKVLTLTYNEQRTDADKLRKAVTKIGYDADDQEAELKAYDKLPACCKKGGHDHLDVD
jgi:periplasmic mercuric ion binding protein